MKKTINVFGQPYRVKIKKLSGLHGVCDLDKKFIHIDDSKGAFSDTLLHEVLHSILFESGITHIIAATEGLEEAIVRAIEHGLKVAGLNPEISADSFFRLTPMPEDPSCKTESS